MHDSNERGNRLRIAALASDGEMEELTAGFNWSATPVGPLADWPQSLTTIVRTMLASRYAMWLGWGPDFTFFYNDAYAKMTLGPKHPWALGKSAREVWAEIWSDIGPRADSVLQTGKATWDEGLLLFLERNGFPEETYHTFSYSPVPDDAGNVGGLLCVVTEDTDRTIGERRLRTLRELAARTIDEAKSAADACRTAAEILEHNPRDVPFAALYLIHDDGRKASLTGAAGIEANSSIFPPIADLSSPEALWPFKEVLESNHGVIVPALAERFESIPQGPWPDPPQQAIVLPMSKPGQTHLAGFLVAGLSSRRLFDDSYSGFLDLLVAQIATALSNARAYEEEKRRAEALAELDRAKTIFFSNVSHEFRTPLTLILGPIEDMLHSFGSDDNSGNRRLVEVVHRNALRLQRLVNTLLDFSRIEAGRMKATFEPVDFAIFTEELSSNSRSACEKAGLTLTVNKDSMNQRVFLDRQLWEKIVLNLLSNAFKFTFTGGITVSITSDDQYAQLSISDTGIGIAPEELPHLFERFHRIENAKGRTNEGSGIGLAMVHELVKLHGGTISVTSEVGQGSTFIVSIPFGTNHLPSEQIRQAPSSLSNSASHSLVEEAIRWLPDSNNSLSMEIDEPLENIPQSLASEGIGFRPSRILVADDNADMRQYLHRLLSGRYQVETVSNGAAALLSIQSHPPDLVLSDVMMPQLDGFGLIKELRADLQTAGIPVILLSAKSGEESRVEGMQAGADDYLSKPFSARELLARIQAHLQTAQFRQEANRLLRASEERFQLFMNHSPASAYVKDSEGRYIFVNRTLAEGAGIEVSKWIGRTDFELFPSSEVTPIRQNDLKVLESKQTMRFEETANRSDGVHHYLSFKFPLQDRNGDWLVAGMSLDVTEQKHAIEAQGQLAAIVESSQDAIVSKDLNGIITSWNKAAERLYGYTADEIIGRSISLLIPEDHFDDLERIMERFRKGENTEHFETVRLAKDGRRIDVSIAVSPILDADGNVIGASKIARDITNQKLAEAAIRKSEERLEAELEAMNKLHALSSRLLSTVDLRAALDDVLVSAIETCSADFGNIQLLNAQNNTLEIICQQGSTEDFIRHFQVVPLNDGSACSRALKSGKRVMIEDVESDSDFYPHRAIAASAGFRSVQSTPLKSHDGSIIGMLSTHYRHRSSISERDERLLDLYARHAADFIERLKYEEALKEADRRKDEFLATLAHELRNPLAPLRNGLQIIRLAEDDPTVIEQVRTMMERQLAQMVRLIDDLLDLSRISRGKIELRTEITDVMKIIHQAVETSRPNLEHAGHKLHLHLPESPLYVNADMTRLAQVFSNLLNNAAKYTKGGGVIDLNVTCCENEVRVSVRDNGLGIPPEMLPHIFEMFTQVDRNLEWSQGGLGIGLSIVKQLINMHQGRVQAMSDGPGKGSEFIVILPRVEAPTPIASLSASPPRSPDKRRVLIVDDNVDAASSLALMLDFMGNETRIAHDGQRAI
ncbi:PAS domain-containing protein, partial [bacterium]|nr:PAS domain-containing protein [bacterium]